MQISSLFLTCCVMIQLFALSGLGDDTSQLFGQSQQSESALIGMMYDLKQQEQSTTPMSGDYSTIVDQFLAKHWDETVLNHFYRVSRPLYTTQIFIPNMDANMAPKAFGAEKTVKPSDWVIHYKAEVSPPSAGTYRFWGCADDVIAVAVNGKSEMVFCRPDMSLPTNGWKQTEPDGAQAADDNLRPGDWFTLGADEIMDLDVIIGERPGGLFNAFLMVEKKGDTYDKDAQGHPILPIFQVATYDTPKLNDVNSEPKFSNKAPPWKCYQ